MSNEQLPGIDDNKAAEFDRDSVLISHSPAPMKVLVRVRPLTENELSVRANQMEFLQVNADSQTIQITHPDTRVSALSFDRVYSMDTNQDTIFQTSTVTEMVENALHGYASTIFAYGQTGSGKTFTITGPALNPNQFTVGIVPRALQYLYREADAIIKQGTATGIRIQASYLEIYNDSVFDLLHNTDKALPVRWSKTRRFYVEDLDIVDCDNIEDALTVLQEGLKNRTVGSHSMNIHSSRSHSLLTIHLEIQGHISDEGLQNRYGKLCFVDLAGSESTKVHSGSLGNLAESLSINKALLTLGKCISALANPKQRQGHIPYRDSKLTKLLSESLSGMGSTMMIACISPSIANFNETLKTLRYASQARRIKGNPVIQLDPVDEKLSKLKSDISLLKKENIMLRELLERDGSFNTELTRIGEQLAQIQVHRRSNSILIPDKRDIRLSMVPIRRLESTTSRQNSKMHHSSVSLPTRIQGKRRSKTPFDDYEQSFSIGQKSPSKTGRNSTFGSEKRQTLVTKEKVETVEHLRSHSRKANKAVASNPRLLEMKRSKTPAGQEKNEEQEQGKPWQQKKPKATTFSDKRNENGPIANDFTNDKEIKLPELPKTQTKVPLKNELPTKISNPEEMKLPPVTNLQKTTVPPGKKPNENGGIALPRLVNEPEEMNSPTKPKPKKSAGKPKSTESPKIAVRQQKRIAPPHKEIEKPSLVKRPSALEQQPQIVNEPFPEPDKNFNQGILEEVKALDNEIRKMSNQGKETTLPPPETQIKIDKETLEKRRAKFGEIQAKSSTKIAPKPTTSRDKLKKKEKKVENKVQGLSVKVDAKKLAERAAKFQKINQ